MWVYLIFFLGLGKALSTDLDESDDSSRKILGSSVVTSVSVILDSGNDNKASFSDAVGKPLSKPQVAKLASPIELLNPDRYEFYTFDESGDLVKRLMTMDEIKAIIATSGDEVFNIDNFSDIIPENRVNDIVTNVQNVLREEIEAHKMPDTNQLFDTPDVSDSWSMILPAIFGNSGEEINPEKTATASTPETLVIGPTQTERSTTEASVTTSTSTPSPFSYFTNYFAQNPTTQTIKIGNNGVTEANLNITSQILMSKTSSANQKLTTNKLSFSQPSVHATTSTQKPKKISTTTDSTILKVQIFPNSNTNSERPYNTLSTSGNIPDSEYVRISTPNPKPILESRISSTILSKTSPSIITRITSGSAYNLPLTQTTPSIQSTFSPLRSSIPLSSASTESTVEKQTETATISSTTFEKLNSPTSFNLTVEEENAILHKLTSDILSHNNLSTTSKSTEKIYILLRPLSSTMSTIFDNTNSTNQDVYTTSSKIFTNTHNDSKTNESIKSTSTEAIFSIIPQEPSIDPVSVVPELTSHHETYSTEPNTSQKVPTRPTTLQLTELDENAKVNEFSTQSNEDFTSYIPDMNIFSFNTTTQSSPTYADNNQAPATSSQVLENQTFPKNDNSSSYVEHTLQTVSNKQSYVTNMTTSIPSTLSDLQNAGSIFNNQYTSNTAEAGEPLVTHSTETQPEIIEQESTIKENTATTDYVSSYTGLQKDLLEKLLLSSTNVYEINSAVTQELTYPEETSSVSEELLTNFPNEQNISAVDVNPTLIESLGQLLAQAVGNISNVSPNENDNIKNQHETDTKFYTSTSKTETFNPYTNIHHSTTYFQDRESTRSPIHTEFTEEANGEITETTENMLSGTNSIMNKFNNLDVEPLTNVSIFRKQNSTKPAKADLSLEIDYDLLSGNRTNLQKQTTTISETTTTTFPSDLNVFTEATTLFTSTPQIENESTNHLHANKSEATTQEQYYTLTSLEQNTHSYSKYTTHLDTTHLDQSISTEKVTAIPSVPSYVTILNTRPSTLNFNKSEDIWTLVSTIAPHGKVPTIERKPTLAPILEPTPTVNLEVNPMQGFGLEESTAKLDADVYNFVQLCNELAFGFWKSVTTGISSARSVIVSPFAATSLLAMVFLGARGSTSGEMNEILKLDNMVTFNPHLTFKTVTESISTGPGSGVAISAIVRQLYSDKSKEKILNFYKERAKFFYDGHVEEVSFKAVGDTIRRRTNLLIKKQTNGKIQEFLKDGSVRVRSPLAAISGSVMQTDCSKGSITDRDGEIYFVVFPSIKQKRLIPIPAIVYREGFLAGYEPSIDATAVALGDKDDIISFIFVLPGRQGINALGDGLSRLEKRLVESSFQKGAWARLLRSLVPRPELEVQIPRFSHRSIINATAALKQMGLTTLFDINKADLRGLNGVAHDLHLSDMLQFNHFSLCGNTNSAHGHHSEYYPATARRSLRKHRRLDHFEQQKILHDDPLYIINYLSLPLNLRPRQARVPQIPRLRLDRPFLYFVRHNPTGFILHMGRFNPRLLP